eukprot:3032508-Heterocapsa_arctica.AAC.1
MGYPWMKLFRLPVPRQVAKLLLNMAYLQNLIPGPPPPWMGVVLDYFRRRLTSPTPEVEERTDLRREMSNLLLFFPHGRRGTPA